MTDTACPRCGFPEPQTEVCPICDQPVEVRAERPAGTLASRALQNGSAGLLGAVAVLVAALAVPLLTLEQRGVAGSRARVSIWSMINAEGRYGAETKSMVLLAVPGAAFFLLSFVLSRRTRRAAASSRPLVFVVSILPVMAVALPPLRLQRHESLVWSFGPAYALVMVAAALGVSSALHFGTGMPEPRPRARIDADPDEGLDDD